MSLLIKNIKGLVQVCRNTELRKKKGSEMMQLEVMKDAYLFIGNGLISDFGYMSDLPSQLSFTEEIDATDRYVLPSWIDCHTHLVFPESRENEFVMKIKGASYEDIAAKGGGILNSASKLRQYSEEDLLSSALKRLDEIIRLGTGAVEIKSGYGLSVEGELKMLRVIKKIKEVSPICVKATFLGAHALPAEFKNDKDAYLNLIISEILPEIQSNNLADYLDVFIEKGFFTPDDAARLIEAGLKAGLKPRLHVDQMSDTGGVDVGIKYNAVSLDHLENISPKNIENLKNSETMPVLLPGCSFYLRMKYPPAREMINAGLPLVLASDYNPGSCPSGNMNFVISLACIQMKMMPEEAINAASINAAFALEVHDKMGAIRKNTLGNLIITKKISSLNFIPYSFGNHVVDTIILEGKVYNGINLH